MPDVKAALDAMAAAEQEAREALRAKWFDDSLAGRWARARVALVARDRATLERHTPQRCAFCNAREIHGSPSQCPDLLAVIDYWTRDDHA